ncbi:MAG TPA: hypothetical protein VGL53_20090 [Bryobacteraceae bacterium]|jgi:hypothetical protein
MTLSRWAIAGYLSLVFVSGGVIGALGHRMYTVSAVSAKTGSPDEWRKNYVAQMKSRLKLRDDQLLRLNILLDETRSRVREVHKRQRPELDQIRKEHSLRVASILDPDQKVQYEKFVKERLEQDERDRQQQDQQEKEKSAAPPPVTRELL